MTISRAAKDMMYKALKMPKYMSSKKAKAEKGLQEIGRKARNEVEAMVNDSKKASENFEHRKDNTHYYESSSYWAKNKN